MSTACKTIRELLDRGADERLAILAPNRPALSYAGLRKHVDYTIGVVRGFGIGRNQRIAIVLPNGPEMASAFVTLGSAATTAPLNPAYRADEFDFYLSDLKPAVLVVARGDEGPATQVARKHKIPVLALGKDERLPAGTFDLVPESHEDAALLKARGVSADGAPQADDIALVLHTSGTTSRPKIVPLMQKNVCASAHHIASTLALTPDDRCLNVMPLFHIHGLIAATLSTLQAGASVVCTEGFNALNFFARLVEFEPSWYTAVPTMHQAILARAERNKEALAKTKLRFIRSSSASLPPQVMAELEKTFNAPVIESYGMTEAAHQMASNPLPPRPRKPGSVGIAAGPEIAIMADDGALLASGQQGEVVIRGPNVTAGYESNPKANEEAFTHGWFRTGDLGVLDKEGYLAITGRKKEIINRGGEKISPREVDEVLLDHPAVAQVVTFGVPHAKLGEDVAAAVVLKPDAQADEKAIRAFAAERLADFKVPRQVLIMDELPKGATGKVQRIGLAQKLGLAK
jgi:acyl-CoA synthetase (AMP-forming)/AMP-acid ligase II